ncbi:hypothetical protein A3G50_02675 [Candidatus Jorgensenbacteria bacterium RIFCSPLOWO2_12_FULL_42_11]|uniref:Uncharacterized protein n=1 Tax=Candidatus Jorgensenbacteria bacterium RIFCSPLOWO2_12_FULL_42_11 TaxID=1798473 RepID=A0A1F6C2Q2_9BACT|nr:MAG: hypothetical protein A3G50_02675 [Candidatus Jorgensenbacteria bacterium RIFCSPLOWO2_12_FULL_42_11]
MPVNNKNARASGQAALPTILLIGGIIMEISIAGILIAFILGNSGWGERLSAQALAAAKAGTEDALLKIAVDKNFSVPGGYSFSVDNRVAEVIVIKDPAGYPSGVHQIISSGKALGRQRKLETILIVDGDTGKVDLKSTREIE